MRIPALILTLLLSSMIGTAWAQGDIKRGQYLVKAAGCMGCHTEEKKDAVPFAGGRALKTPFGTFYGPNITPHPQAGIGNWKEADFVRAIRHGERPDGANYFPAFPYPSFTGIVDADLRDLYAYLRSLPPNARPNQPHDLKFPFGWRFLVTFWKWLFFTPGPFIPNQALSQVVNRGAYLVQALGHCGECHTPRNFLGGPKRDRLLGGGQGPEGKDVPNLTPAALKKRSDGDLKEFLVTGLTADGDVPAESMAEVIRNTTSQLAPQDMDALIAYLRVLPSLATEGKSK
ncbi:MAG: c-type cytochrome [Betaproteobacteria bacterium]|nr:c-type cytochrome [Betaproteobacteria bacterium]